MTIKVVAPGVVELVREQQPGVGVVLQARDFRTNFSGVHADIYIYGLRDGKRKYLYETDINLTKGDQRKKVLNEARSRAGPEWNTKVLAREDPSEAQLRDRAMVVSLFGNQIECDIDFDQFCLDVEETLDAIEMPKAVAGQMLGPQEFIAKPHVLANSGTILFGPGGSGKSTTAFLCAVAVDSGTNGIWGTVPQGVPTLYINLERSPESIIRRIFAANQALELEPDRPLAVLTARGKSLTAIEPQVRKFVLANNIGFIVLDSISRARMGSLTDDSTANETIDTLNSFGCAWLAIGHTAKPPQNADGSKAKTPDETFGSVHYGNGADITVKLTAEKMGLLETGVRLEVKKANDIATPPPMTLSLKFDEDYGLASATKTSADMYPALAAADPSVSVRQSIQMVMVREGKPMTMVAIATALNMAGAKDIAQVRTRLSEWNMKEWEITNPGVGTPLWGLKQR